MQRINGISRQGFDRNICLKDAKEIFSKIRKNYKIINRNVKYDSKMAEQFTKKSTCDILLKALQRQKKTFGDQIDQIEKATIKKLIKKAGILSQW